MASLPTGEPRNGLGVLRPLTTDESAIRRQGIINMICRDSSQWLNANPAYLFNRMNNEEFTLAYKRRSMRRLMGSGTNCVFSLPTTVHYASISSIIGYTNLLDLTPNLSSSHLRHLVPSIQKLASSFAITSLLVQHTTQAWSSETL